METKLLYQTDSYLKEFEAIVVDVVENAIILDQTAFAPKAGGLQSDKGYITIDSQKFELKEAKIKSGVVYHFVEPLPTIDLKNKKVVGVIDWERRYRQMRLHTAFHAISGILFKKYGCSVTGGNITPEKARAEFELDHLRQERIQEIKEEMEKIIQEDHPIKIYFMPREEAIKHPDLIRTKVNLIPEYVKTIRVVEIEGVDIQADGGVHVKSTKEIGTFVPIKSENRGKHNKRLYFTVEP